MPTMLGATAALVPQGMALCSTSPVSGHLSGPQPTSTPIDLHAKLHQPSLKHSQQPGA